MSDEHTTNQPATPVGPADDEPVPKLPRGRGLRLSPMQLFRIIGLAALLIFLLVTQRPCANAVSTFVTGFDDQGSGTGSASGGSAAGSAGDKAGSQQYEHLKPGMTDEETKAAIDRARAKAAGSGSGS
jgi:hypothetical protein